MYVPKQLFFTKGVGTHREKLTSFEMALRDASIACYNLVRVSSIFPPNCEEISVEEGVPKLQPGQIVHVVMSECATAEPNRLIAASVGVAKPRDKNVRSATCPSTTPMARPPRAPRTMPKTLPPRCSPPCWASSSTPTASWDEKREIWRIADVIYQTKEVTADRRRQQGRHGLWIHW